MLVLFHRNKEKGLKRNRIFWELPALVSRPIAIMFALKKKKKERKERQEKAHPRLTPNCQPRGARGPPSPSSLPLSLAFVPGP